VTVIFEPAVTVDAGINDTICADLETIALDGSVLVASGGQWSINGALGNGTFNPSPPVQDTVTYTITKEDTTRRVISFILASIPGGTPCLTVFDTVTYIITPAPTAFPGVDSVICADQGVYGLNGSVFVTDSGSWTSGGDGTFTDSLILDTDYFLGLNDANVLPGTENLITITLRSENNGRCNPVDSAFQLTVTEVPIVLAGNDRGICQDKDDILFTGAGNDDALIFGATTTGEWSTL